MAKTVSWMWKGKRYYGTLIRETKTHKFARTKNGKNKKDKEKIMAITYRGEKFSGYNKPKRTPKHPTKSHAVLAKEGSKVKLIRFGQQGVSGAGKNPKSAKDKARENHLRLDMQRTLKKGKMSAAYWANKTKW